MCGIVGYLGTESAKEFVMNGLKLLQNRGYDSVGICSIIDASLNVIKYASTDTYDALYGLDQIVNKTNEFTRIGIGHTRWATHGSKTTVNAHPHTDHKHRIALVHNGIIENYMDLKRELLLKEIHCKSQTDSEIIALYIGSYLDEGISINNAIQNTVNKLVGTWALAIVHTDYPNKIWITRNGSPLLLGIETNFIMIASEPIAFNNQIKRYIVLDSNDLIEITHTGETLLYGENIHRYNIKECAHVDIETNPIGYSHWMIKEIMEQPLAVQRVLNNGGRIETDITVKLGGLDLCKNRLLETNHLIILGCGTSLNAGLAIINTYKRLDIFDTVQCYDGAEFNRYDIPRSGKSCVIMLSQSGETADLHQCLHIVKESELITIGIVNVVDSFIARETDCGVYLNAGREVAVASTKSFTNQYIALVLVAIWFSQNRNTSVSKRRKMISDIRKLSFQIQDTLSSCDDVYSTIQSKLNTRAYFILGKGSDEAIARECSLKLKEISYIHAESYSSSALKHGPFAIIESNLPIFIIDTVDEYHLKNISACQEVLARGAYVIFITMSIEQMFTHENLFVIHIKKNDTFGGLLANIYIQKISYNISIQNGYNPDYPRNLAKVVSV
jgi:glucosamine--fructose-6-phosphate aminotransferase (isomerizing)